MIIVACTVTPKIELTNSGISGRNYGKKDGFMRDSFSDLASGTPNFTHRSFTSRIQLADKSPTLRLRAWKVFSGVTRNTSLYWAAGEVGGSAHGGLLSAADRR